MVIYHGQARWQVSRQFSDLIAAPPEFQPYIPDYRYWLCDLSQYSDEVIVGAVELQVALLLLKYILQPEFWDRLPGILRLPEQTRPAINTPGYSSAGSIRLGLAGTPGHFIRQSDPACGA